MAYSDVAPNLFIPRLAHGDSSQKQIACLDVHTAWLLSPALKSKKITTAGSREQGSKCGLAWQPTPLTPACRKQRQSGLCELEGSLLFRLSSRPDRDT